MAFGRATLSGDELHVVNSVLKFFRDFHFSDPYAYAFPVMTVFYVAVVGVQFGGLLWLGVFPNIDYLTHLAIVDPGLLIPLFRLVTVGLSVAILFITYKIAKLIFNHESTAILALWLTGTSFIFAKNSFIALKWIPQLAVILLIFWLILFIKDKSTPLSMWHYLVGGVLSALSYGVAIVGLVIIFPMGILWNKLRKQGLVGPSKNGLLIFCVSLFLVCFIISVSTPDLILSNINYVSDVATMGSGESIRNEAPGYRFWGYVEQLLRVDFILVFLAFIGLITGLRRYKYFWWQILSIIVVYYVMLGPVMGAIRLRRMVVIIPFMAILAAAGAVWLSDKYKKTGQFVVGILLIGLIINPLLVVAEVKKKDSKLEARKWIMDNLPNQSFVYDECLLELPESSKYIEALKGSRELTTRQSHLLSQSIISEKSFFVISDPANLDHVGRHKNHEYSYLVLCFNNIPDGPEYKNEINGQMSYFGFDPNFSLSDYKMVYDSTVDQNLDKAHWHYLVNQVDPWYLSSRLFEEYAGDHIRIINLTKQK